MFVLGCDEVALVGVTKITTPKLLASSPARAGGVFAFSEDFKQFESVRVEI